MTPKANKLQSQRIAERIRELEQAQRVAEEREDKEADALLLRLARKSHLRDDFIRQARDAVKQHEHTMARAGEHAGGQETSRG